MSCFAFPGSLFQFSTSNCSLCAAGTFSADFMASTCVSCPTGTHTTSSGKELGLFSSFGSCGERYDSRDTGDNGTRNQRSVSREWISVCPACSFVFVLGSSACVACEAGRYARVASSPVCDTCAPGFYSSARAGSCTPCALGSISIGPGACCLFFFFRPRAFVWYVFSSIFLFCLLPRIALLSFFLILAPRSRLLCGLWRLGSFIGFGLFFVFVLILVSFDSKRLDFVSGVCTGSVNLTCGCIHVRIVCGRQICCRGRCASSIMRLGFVDKRKLEWEFFFCLERECVSFFEFFYLPRQDHRNALCVLPARLLRQSVLSFFCPFSCRLIGLRFFVTSRFAFLFICSRARASVDLGFFNLEALCALELMV